ncbi:PLP-dependent aminotransferase family protein [Moellerella wisconsensis]|uniref:MocR-like pyridoxine biosynthesis transcription factor PdxR n=1 Tax=Moellerella wisconsensis TaxID=158849 RepID=UPI001F4E77F3|nr:PLP-dependent aminotransferase family protein [Moellerella wisconsensis]UNH28303.1 PLP-dependent aminotransferase family protein [Moellerella wisconsensis]UNH43462.1 PLP-dependent aminotransferase family protein [Moellerella wisconsensis]
MTKKNQYNFPILPIKNGLLHEQVYHSLRDAILDGRLHPGNKIPSSRAMAEILSISRNSIIAGFERLLDEGYLVTKRGSGTYISDIIPDELTKVQIPTTKSEIYSPVDLEINPNIYAMLDIWKKLQASLANNSLFNIGIGCADLFPHQTWGRLLKRAWRQYQHSQISHNDPAGFQPLRAAISQYARATRGLNCTEEQIIIVNGTQQAINLATQVLTQPSNNVWLDDPGYDGAYGVFLSAGMTVNSVTSDQQGMDVFYAIKNLPTAKLVFTAPSHQFPLGGVLSLERRLHLLEWAAEHKSWIFEDDYNSEFRYSGRPLQALQGLDKYQRVIYAGSFSKMMFPEFRLGFMIVPTPLIDAFKLAKYYADSSSSFLEQATLTLFITEGHYARHVRRVRRACNERKKALVDAIERYLGDKFCVHPADSGIHLVCWLRHGLTEDQVIEASQTLGFKIQPLSRYCRQPPEHPAVLLGFAAHSAEELIAGIKALALLI